MPPTGPSPSPTAMAGGGTARGAFAMPLLVPAGSYSQFLVGGDDGSGSIPASARETSVASIISALHQSGRASSTGVGVVDLATNPALSLAMATALPHGMLLGRSGDAPDVSGALAALAGRPAPPSRSAMVPPFPLPVPPAIAAAASGQAPPSRATSTGRSLSDGGGAAAAAAAAAAADFFLPRDMSPVPMSSPRSPPRFLASSSSSSGGGGGAAVPAAPRGVPGGLGQMRRISTNGSSDSSITSSPSRAAATGNTATAAGAATAAPQPPPHT